MRPIDADKMQEWAFQFNFEGRITERELYLFNRAIEEMPTVDAVPVRHGKWRCTGDKDEWYGYIYTCSECGHEHMMDSDEFYCPHCGARLELDGGDEDATD